MIQLTGSRTIRVALRIPYGISGICIGTAIIQSLCAGHRELPALYFLAVVVPLTLALVPSAKPDWRRALAPHNMVILFFMLEMFGEPLNLAVFNAQSLIPNHIRASDRSINGVLILLGCAFVSYIAGYCSHFRRGARPRPSQRSGTRLPARAELLLAAAFVAVGCASLYLYFGGFSSYVYQLSHPEGQRAAAAALSSTWQGITGLHLKQFLTFGIVGLWCYAIDRLPRRKRTRNASLVTLAALPLIALASASFNRASMVVPLVGVMVVFSNRVKRVPFLLLGVILGILLLLAASWGMYRSSERDIAEFYVSEQLDKAPATLQAELSELLTTATALGQSEEDGKSCCRLTVIDSVLSPLPVIGKSFRDNSGVSVFNSLVYGEVGVADQVVPFYFELFQNLHLAGIAIGYFILGKVIRRLQRAYGLSRRGSASREFSIFMVSFWVALLSIYSLGVLSQVVITLLPPAFVVLWVTRERRARRSRPALWTQELRLYANPVHGA